MDKATIEPFYHKFNNWLLDFLTGKRWTKNLSNPSLNASLLRLYPIVVLQQA